MTVYKVQVSTGQGALAGTFDTISITLLGIDGESPKNVLDNYWLDFQPGRFELAVFMPNYPSSMRKPPPQNKAKVTLKEFLDTIPEMNTTSLILSVLWVLRNEDRDMRPLGTYPEEHFTEHGPKQLMAAFQDRLAEISREIEERNQSLALSYN
ncbi:hydroperoxide isomerase ALOXE3 isoform X1 [Caretta caretta]|uniref:hydroperoxide isomerase ALOXE3 isoform X1 n=1 Tax=Caretta caretta TaxID=8467 RepID=UPI003F4C48E0